MKHLILAVMVAIVMAFAIVPSVEATQLCQTTSCECTKNWYLKDTPEYKQKCADYMNAGAVANTNYWTLVIPVIAIFSATTIIVVGIVYSKKKRNKHNQ